MPILKVEGAKGGEIVDILTTEILKNGTGLSTGGCSPAYGNRLVCRAGDQTHQFYNIMGVRYMTNQGKKQSRLDA